MTLLLLLSFLAVADSGATIYGETEIFEPISANEIAVAANGDVYILSFASATIIHYSAEGKRLGEFGGKGEGPGEFSFPGKVSVCQGSVYVNDDGQNKVHVFDLQGEHQQTLIKPASFTGRVAGGWVFANMNDGPDASGPIEVQLAGENFSEPQTVVSLARTTARGLRVEMNGNERPKVKYNPVSDGPSIVVSDDGKTVFARAAGGFDVHVIDVATRKVVRTISGDEKGVPFNKEYGEMLTKELADNMRERHSPVILVPDFPDYFPPVRDLATMDNLLVVRQWAGQPDTDERFLMLDAMGKELPLPCTPRNMVRLLALKGEYAYVGAHSEDMDGYVVRVPRNRVNETAAAHPLEGERGPRFLMRGN